MYPREITTEKRLLPFYSKINQDKILTNAKCLTKNDLKLLKKFGIKRIRIGFHGGARAHCNLTNSSLSEYQNIIKHIQLAVQEGFTVETFCTIYKDNHTDIKSIAAQSYKMGVKKIHFLSLMPIGNGAALPLKWFLKPDQFKVFILELAKSRTMFSSTDIRLSLGAQWGPNFYSRGIYRHLMGDSAKTSQGFESRYFCPAVSNLFLGITWPERLVYPCFQLIADPKYNMGHVNSTMQIRLTRKNYLAMSDLASKLRGGCSINTCVYNPLCLGGCRSTAMLWGVKNKEKHPEFAELPLCITRSLGELLGENNS